MTKMNENSNFYKAIENAIIIPAAREMAQTPDCDVQFSERYKRKIHRLIKDQKKPYYPLIKTNLRKAICLTAAILLMGSMTVAAVTPIREWFVGLFVKNNGKNADVFAVQGDVPSEELPNNFIYCEPTFIPSGFEENIRKEKENQLIIGYCSVNNKTFQYYQDTLTTKYQIDTENMTTETVSINGYEAYLSFDEENSIIVWNDGLYSYSISGELCKSDIIKVANSVNPTK
jgi:hypothetical protein